MQSDAPHGDPRLQRTHPGPRVATGLVDPCIVFLETTLPGEIPLLAACWAKSSREICEIGRRPYLELTDVLIIQNHCSKKTNRKNLWALGLRSEKCIFITRGAPGRGKAKCSSISTGLENAVPPIFSCVIRQLDQEANEALDQIMYRSKRNFVPLIKAVFESAELDWPSISDALASLEEQEPEKERKFRKPKPANRRGSTLVRRLISALFKSKKHLLVPT